MAAKNARVQMESERQPAPGGPRANVPDASLEYVLYVFIGIGLCAVALFVFLYGQRGDVVLRDLSEREPNAMMKEGIRHEWAGDLGVAAASYRRALALGFGDYWAEFGCKERLTGVLIKKGQLPELKLEDAVKLDATNLIANAGFEEGDGTPGWLRAGEDAAGLEPDVFEIIGGKRSLRVDLGQRVALSQRRSAVLENDIAVLPGYAYRVSGWLRTVDVEPNGVCLGVVAPGAEDGPFHPRCELFLGSRDWQQVMARFTPPDGVTRVGLVLEIWGEGQGAETGTAWLDQCAIVRDQHSGLKNGSFESGEDGRRFWLGEPQPGARFVPDAEIVVEGERSLRIEYAARVGQSIRQEAAVEEGGAYRLEAWLRVHDIGGKGVQLVVRDVPTNGKTFVAASGFVSGTADWAKTFVDFTVPEGVYAVSAAIHRPAGEHESGGALWIDGCALVRTSEGAQKPVP